MYLLGPELSLSHSSAALTIVHVHGRDVADHYLYARHLLLLIIIHKATKLYKIAIRLR